MRARKTQNDLLGAVGAHLDSSLADLDFASLSARRCQLTTQDLVFFFQIRLGYIICNNSVMGLKVSNGQNKRLHSSPNCANASKSSQSGPTTASAEPDSKNDFGTEF
jgi:hypothetical protein